MPPNDEEISGLIATDSGKFMRPLNHSRLSETLRSKFASNPPDQLEFKLDLFVSNRANDGDQANRI